MSGRGKGRKPSSKRPNPVTAAGNATFSRNPHKTISGGGKGRKPSSKQPSPVTAAESRRASARPADDPQPTQDDVLPTSFPLSDPGIQSAESSPSVLSPTGSSVRERNTGMSEATASNSFVAGNIHLEQGANMRVEIQADEAVEKIKERTARRIEERTRGMVETAALSEIMDKLKRVKWVTIKGQAGEGKTTAAFMALQKLQESGREVFHVSTPEEFSKVTTVSPPPVILLDDIIGTLEFDPAAWSRWRQVIYDILDDRDHASNEKKSKEKQVTIILVSRNYVLNDALNEIGKLGRYFTDNNHVVFMSKSGERKYSEKVVILKAICDAKEFHLDDETIDRMCHVNGPHGFPHTCRLFVTLRLQGVEIDTVKFMESPLEFLNQTVQIFLDDGTKQLLFKEMIKRDGKLSIRKIESLENSYAVRKLADSLLDSYLRKEDDCFTFHHPSIYDSVSFNLAKYFPFFVIKHCSLSFLHERVRVEPSRDTKHATPSESHLVVSISRTYMTDLAKRFAAEIENRNLTLVLSHTALTDQLFIEELTCCITLPLTELLTLTDKQTKQSFLSLVASNKSPQLLKYIEKETDKQLTEGDINTVLYGVCKYAASDVLTYLLQSCDTLDINVRYKDDKTPLMIASATRDSQFVLQLMSHSHNLEARDRLDYQTVLYYLCQYGLKAAVEEAIDRGVDINVEDRTRKSPLKMACEYNQVEVARVLLNRGAKWDAWTVVEACSEGRLDLVELLFEIGATFKMTAYRYTHLTAASKGGHVKVMRFLIAKGASVNTAEKSGRSPLHVACYYNKPQAVQLLLEHGADINSEISWDGDTSLHIAAMHGYKDIIDMLANGGAIIDTANRQGQTPLHTAVYYKPPYSYSRPYLPDISVCQTLINHGALVNKQDTEGNTPLHLLCQVDSHTEIDKDWTRQPASDYKDLYRSLVTLLVDQGAVRKIQNNIGTLALHGWCKTLTD